MEGEILSMVHIGTSTTTLTSVKRSYSQGLRHKCGEKFVEMDRDNTKLPNEM